MDEEMRTVKEVADLTGVSVRTLHYYDEIGLLKPSGVSAAGYRLYGTDKLEELRVMMHRAMKITRIARYRPFLSKKYT